MAQEQRIQQVEDDVDRVDPENPMSMVVPVPGDRVLMTDGSTARVAARREVGGGVMLQVQRAGLDYAEWVGVEEIEAHLDDDRVHDVVEAWDLAHAEDAERKPEPTTSSPWIAARVPSATFRITRQPRDWIVCREDASEDAKDDVGRVRRFRTEAAAAEAAEELNAADAVDAFNAAHPIGTTVRYWPGVREGEGIVSTTRTTAWVVGGDSPVVSVEGYSGGIALTHVEVIASEPKPAADPWDEPTPSDDGGYGLAYAGAVVEHLRETQPVDQFDLSDFVDAATGLPATEVLGEPADVGED